MWRAGNYDFSSFSQVGGGLIVCLKALPMGGAAAAFSNSSVFFTIFIFYLVSYSF